MQGGAQRQGGAGSHCGRRRHPAPAAPAAAAASQALLLQPRAMRRATSPPLPSLPRMLQALLPLLRGGLGARRQQGVETPGEPA